MSDLSDEQQAELDAILAANGVSDADIEYSHGTMPPQATILGTIKDFTVCLIQNPVIQTISVLLIPFSAWDAYEKVRPYAESAYVAGVDVLDQFKAGKIDPVSVPPWNKYVILEPSYLASTTGTTTPPEEPTPLGPLPPGTGIIASTIMPDEVIQHSGLVQSSTFSG